MIIAVAQTRPAKGDIERNIEAHINLLNLAIKDRAEAILFPELSLTGYEPGLAKVLAMDKENARLTVFQTMSDSNNIIIGVGLPTKEHNGTCISLVIFQPQQQRQVYSKKFLHEDETPFFISGENNYCLITDHITLSICYELSIPEHAKDAFEHGAEIYITSVAKTAEGMYKASQTLAGIAKQYGMIILLSNCVGPCDDFVSAGQSAAWDNTGNLLGQLDASSEGLLIVDTETKEIIQL